MPSRPAAAALLVKLARKLLRLVPRGGVRRDLARHEAAHGLAHRLVLGRQGRMDEGHAVSSSASNCPGATCAPGDHVHRLDARRLRHAQRMLHLHRFEHDQRAPGLGGVARLGVDRDHAAVHRRDEAAVARPPRARCAGACVVSSRL